MNKQLARDIVNLLGTQQHVGVLSDYADAQIEKAKKNLVTAADMNAVSKLQGYIMACEELKKIRDTAVGVLNLEK